MRYSLFTRKGCFRKLQLWYIKISYNEVFLHFISSPITKIYVDRTIGAMIFLQIISLVDLDPLYSAINCELTHFRTIGLFAISPGHAHLCRSCLYTSLRLRKVSLRISGVSNTWYLWWDQKCRFNFIKVTNLYM